MSKRNKEIILTREAKALKKLRKNSGLSLRKTADRMDISFTRVHQMESGREDISSEYINLFLEVTGISEEDWRKETGGRTSENKLKDECISIIKSLDSESLVTVLSILHKFSLIVFFNFWLCA